MVTVLVRFNLGAVFDLVGSGGGPVGSGGGLLVIGGEKLLDAELPE